MFYGSRSVTCAFGWKTNDLPLEQLHFPPCLTTLTLDFCTFLHFQEWSSITLPAVTTLNFDMSRMPWGEQPLLDAALRLTPHLPNLKRMGCDRMTLLPMDQTYYSRIFAELGRTVETLHFQGTLLKEVLLKPKAYANFPQLQRLIFQENAAENRTWPLAEPLHEDPIYTSTVIRALFPASLQYLDITWSSGVYFGTAFMTELAEASFLPNLKRCPNFHYDVNFQGLDDNSILARSAIVKDLVRHAWNAAPMIRQNRPAWPRSNPLRFSVISENEMPLLPLPLDYMEAIPALVADTLRELQSSASVE